MGPQITKRSTLLGVPIGPRRTDWVQVGKLAAMGLGVVSTAAGGVGAKAAGSKLKDKASESAQAAKQTMGKVSDAAGKASEIGSKLTGGDKKGGGDKNLKKLRLIIKESIDVAVPVETAYNQWTQFTEMPSILRSVQSVDHESDEEVRWTVKIGPSRRRWTAKIVEQIPDERIVWESTDGTENRGTITFHRLDDHLTRVQVEMEYFPHGAVEKVGNIFLAARRRTRKDLRLYKHYLELAGSETGAWRGEIHENGDQSGGGTEPEAEQKADRAQRAERPQKAQRPQKARKSQKAQKSQKSRKAPQKRQASRSA